MQGLHFVLFFFFYTKFGSYFRFEFAVQSMSCNVVSCHVIKCHFMSFHVISCHFMSFYVIICYSLLFHFISVFVFFFITALSFLSRKAMKAMMKRSTNYVPSLFRAARVELERVHLFRLYFFVFLF